MVSVAEGGGGRGGGGGGGKLVAADLGAMFGRMGVVYV